MNAHTEKRWVAGRAGPIEVAFDAAVLGSRTTADDAAPGHALGVALICHPHPLHGGTMDNKVVQTLARAFTQAGWDAVRFNFRGVAGSQGTWDEGRGEIDDARDVLKASLASWARATPSTAAQVAIAGFSFGGFVAAQLASEMAAGVAAPSAVQPEAGLAAANALRHVVLVGPATRNFPVPAVPPHTLVIHGEQDDVVPLSATFDWARPQALPVVVVPGGGHFFHGQLPLLKSLVLRHLV
jgi:uncharacterized protein